jgi:energy-coupling factor transporter transmembrane protein EcfT
MWGKHYNFPYKTLWIATVSLRMIFFQIIFVNFIFFNIEFFENYNYKSLQIRLNHVGKNCSFYNKTL